MFSINPVLILHITTANKFILSFSGPFPVAQWTRVKKNTPGITKLATVFKIDLPLDSKC